jgi:hypothetical protein
MPRHKGEIGTAVGQLDAVLGALEVLPFEAPADSLYGVLRARLEQAGQPIGASDLSNSLILDIIGDWSYRLATPSRSSP